MKYEYKTILVVNDTLVHKLFDEEVEEALRDGWELFEPLVMCTHIEYHQGSPTPVIALAQRMRRTLPELP